MLTALKSSAVPMVAAEPAAPRWPVTAFDLPDGNIVEPRDAEEVSALVLRHDGDAAAMQVEQTPAQMVVVRIFLAPCSLSVLLGTQWVPLGDMVQGGMHLSHAHQIVRTEWHGAREGLMLCIPASLWRDQAVMQASLSTTQRLDLSVDATLLQLTKMLLNSTQCESDTAFFRHMVEVIVARIGVLRSRVMPSDGARNGLPRWRLQRVMAYVREHVAEAISLADMAASAGMSPMHFAAQFRAATGLRPHHYLLQCRIQHAKALLMDASRTLIDVAICAGFRTQAHFTTVFKNLEQMTPMQWRRSRLEHLG
jgi:AraC-like DNA-binding protein